MNHSLLTGSILNECTDRNNSCYDSVIGFAYNGLKYDCIYNGLSHICAITVYSSDKYGSVIVDVDLCTGVSNDLLDNLSTCRPLRLHVSSPYSTVRIPQRRNIKEIREIIRRILQRIAVDKPSCLTKIAVSHFHVVCISPQTAQVLKSAA